MKFFKKKDKQAPESVENGVPEEVKNVGAAVRKKKKRRRIIIAVVAVVLVALYGRSKLMSNVQQMDMSMGYLNATATEQPLKQALTGTGTIEPADKYTVKSLLSGDILTASFEEGDVVKKDMVLYQIDSSNAQTKIDQSKISLGQSQRSYADAARALDDLKLKSTEGGKIVDMDWQIGDSINAGDIIAVIRNSETMKLEIPFIATEAVNFYIGQPAAVTLDGTFEVLSGNVSKISTADSVGSGNIITRVVTIDVKNPGGIASGQAATAMIGSASSIESAVFAFKADEQVMAKATGKVATLHHREGDTVAKNEVLITLSNDALQSSYASAGDSVRNSQITLNDQYEQLDDYAIKSPISGTIITKNYKAGDAMESGKDLCTIFDLSYLTMTLNVDELDITSVQVGQEATITVEALDNAVYYGKVTKINIDGKTENGVTTYPVEIRIDEAGDLMPGMNVEAEIMVAERASALVIPAAAIARGNMILVQTDRGEAPAPEEGAPAGFTYVEVEVGISDGEFIEVLSGLEKDDVIAYQDVEPDMGDMMMYGGW